MLAENIGRLIAENEALSTKEAVALFCVKMNEEAALLGAEQSHFANPDGYHHEEHYTTAYDLLLISLEALQHPTIREICAMTTSTRTLVSGQKVTWNNNNQLLQQKSLYYYPGVTGLKSGFTSPAGHCMVATLTKAGKEYVAIVLKSPNSTQRWLDILQLLHAA